MSQMGAAPRARQSLAFIPSARDKENTGLDPSTSHRKKRAQSLGGSPLEGLSPSKRARRSLVPGKSILRKSLAGATIAFNIDEEHNTRENTRTVPMEEIRASLMDETMGSMAMDLDDEDDQSMVTTGRRSMGGRKSIGGPRVSFAAHASLRLFEKDSDQTSEPSEASSTPPRVSPNDPQRRRSSLGTTGEQSMDLIGSDADGATGLVPAIEGPSSPMALPGQTAGAAALSLLDEPEPEDDVDMTGDSTAMSLAGDEVTRAFAANTAIMARQQEPEPVKRVPSSSSDDDAHVASQLLPDPPFSPDVKAPQQEEEDEDAEMEMSMQGEAAIKVLDDGQTRRRLSTSGAVRRASMAPTLGRKALNILDAPEEEDTTAFDDAAEVDEAEPEAAQEEIAATPTPPETEPEPEPVRRPNAASLRASLSGFNLFSRVRDSIVPKVRASLSPQGKARHVSEPVEAPQTRVRESIGIIRASAEPQPSAPISPPKASVAEKKSAPPSRLPVRVGSPSNASATPFAAPSSLAKPRPSVVERKLSGSPVARSPSPSRRTAPASPLKSVIAAPSPSSEDAPAVEEPARVDEEPPVDDIKDEDDAMLVDEELAPMSEAAQPPSMGINDFLELTNTEFMEDMFARRRKSIAPSGFGEATGTHGPPTLADQVVAAASFLPQLRMFQHMTEELKVAMRENEDFMLDLDDSVSANPPELFVRYEQASPEERATIETMLKLAKNYFRLEVREDWYTYRSNLFIELSKSFAHHVAGLEEDHRQVVAANQQLDGVLPDLRKRRQELQIELVKEQARQAELDEVDQELLESLREGMVEQAEAISDRQRAQAEAEDDLARLEAKLSDLETQRTDMTMAIARSRKYCEDVHGFTQTEVDRLRTEFELLQDLTDWRLLEFNATEAKLRHRDEIEITMALTTGPKVERCEMSLLPTIQRTQQQKDAIVSTILQFFFDRLKEVVEAECAEVEAPVLLRRLATSWTTVHRLSTEIAYLQLKYPCSFTFITTESGSTVLRIAAEILASKVGAIVDVVLEITGRETLESDGVDKAIQAVGLDVALRYSSDDLDLTELGTVIRQRIATGGRGLLLEACSLAEAQLNSMA